MRQDARHAPEGGNHLHYHDGSTCHGQPTREGCEALAISNGWVGKVLEREDTYADGTRVRCYSLIAGSFDHYAKQGRYVAEVRLVATPITDNSGHCDGCGQPHKCPTHDA